MFWKSSPEKKKGLLAVTSRLETRGRRHRDVRSGVVGSRFPAMDVECSVP
jgi:hypothetical protein